MTEPAAPVRCYSCSSWEEGSQERCGKCGSAFQRLCGCGTMVSVFVAKCPACGNVLRRMRRKKRKLPLKAAGITLAVVLGAAGAWNIRANWKSSHVAAWRLKNDAADKYRSKKYDEAAKIYKKVVEDDPQDAQSWYMLAAAYKSAAMGPEVYVEPAKTAYRLDPNLVEALNFLAVDELERGRVESALDYAQKADRSPSANARSAELVAECETRLARPDYGRALAALLHAKALGSQSPELPIRIAELRLRLVGPIRPELYPPELTQSMRDAESALANPAVYERLTPDRLALFRARLKLALGLADEAVRLADQAVNAMAADVDPHIKAQILVVRAHAVCIRNGAASAAADLAAALQVSQDQETAADVASVLADAADGEPIVAVLRRASENDPKGAIHAVLAEVLKSRGDLDGAMAAIVAARQAGDDDARLHVLEGDVLAAQGKIEDARKAFVEAASRSPRMLEPKLRLELLALVEAPPEGKSQDDVLREGVERLQALRADYGDDAQILAALGTVKLALGEARAARADLQAATKAAPGNAALWVALAKAHRESYEDDSLDQAVAALRRARLLAPEDASVVAEEVSTRLLLGDPSNAAVAANSFLNSHPNDAGVLRLRARAYSDLGQWAAAAADLAAARKAGASDEGVLVDLVVALTNAGNEKAAHALIDESKGKVSERTLSLLETIAPLRQGSAAAAIAKLKAQGPSSLLASLQLRAGKVDDAAATARELLKAAPRDPDATNVLVFALLEGANTPAKTAEARAAAEAVGEDAARGLRNLLVGRVLIAEGRPADAVHELKKAVTLMPGNPVAQLCYGEALARNGAHDEGLAVLRRAAAMPGAPAVAGVMLSRRLLEASAAAKTPKAAEALAGEAWRLDPGSADAAETFAVFLHKKGEFRSAAEVVERALAVEGLAPDAAQRLRKCAIMSRLCAGEISRAVTQLDSMPEAERTGTFAVLVRGFAAITGKRYDEAEKLLRPLAFDGKGSAIAGLGVVVSWLGRGDAKAALGVVAEWHTAFPEDGDLPLATASVFASSARFAESIECAKVCLASRPADRAAASLVTDGLARLGRGPEAIDAARRYAAGAPDQFKATGRLLACAAIVKYGGDPREALATAKEIGADPATPEASVREAKVVQAEALAVMGQDAEAERTADALTRDWVDDRPVATADALLERRIRFVLGVAAARAGRIGAAVPQFARCVEIDPSDVAAGNNLAWALTKTGNAARALDVARRVTTIEPTIADYWDTRGQAAQAAGAAADAEESWGKALEILRAKPKDAAGAFGAPAMRLVRLLEGTGRAAEAKKLAQEVADRVPGAPEATEARALLSK